MNQALDWWNNKHQKYATESWINEPTIFSLWAINYFPNQGKLLELGAGHGQDTRFFANKGYQITSTDFSDSALKYNQEKTPANLSSMISFQKVDLSQPPLPFEDNSFDIVYSHLSLHYFDDMTTDKAISEIFRVLKPQGIIAVLVNSTSDPEYNTGKKLAEDFFELSPGDVKHFFSLAYMQSKMKQFETIVLDNHGSTHKDSIKGVFELIRFIGRKK